MSETKRIVKCVLGFLLAIIIIVGGAVGLDVDVTVQEDAETTQAEVEETVLADPETEENVPIEDETEVGTEQSTVESTPTEDEVTSADESADTEVTEPTDETQNTVTE